MLKVLFVKPWLFLVSSPGSFCALCFEVVQSLVRSLEHPVLQGRLVATCCYLCFSLLGCLDLTTLTASSTWYTLCLC